MTFDDDQQTPGGTPPEGGSTPETQADANPTEPAANPSEPSTPAPDSTAGAGSTEPASAPAGSAPLGSVQPGWWPSAPPSSAQQPAAPQPPAPQLPAPQPTWEAPGAWRPAQPSWPPASPSWPQQGWPQAPQSGYQPAPPAPPAWPPVQPPAWPPTPQPSYGSDNWFTPPAVAHHRPSRLPLILTVVAAALMAFAGGMVVDHYAVPAPQPTQQLAGQPLKDFQVYEQALQDIRANYVGRASLTDQQLLYGSIRGMVEALGDTNHSRFLTPSEYAQMNSQLSGAVAGIGILVTQNNGQVQVDRVITDSPADKAGMKAGDVITAVNGKSISGETFDQITAQIRGAVGTSLTITVIHAGATTGVDITMKRAMVTAPLVDWGMVPGTKIADIALFEFADGAGDQVQAAIEAAVAQHATGIILDLRGNPGGLATEARNVASDFLSSGVVYQEEDAAGKRTSITVDTSRASTANSIGSLPMVVLVDHDTASAAEIVAGALKDSTRAKIVGLTTIGTGTVLEPFVLSDGSVVLLGVEDWLTPSGQKIFNIGITPDTTVALPIAGQPLDPIKLPTMTAAQFNASTDAQLIAGVKAIQKK